MDNNKEIIGICGRKESGKTVLGQICEEYGYERIYFAQPLKKLVAKLINGNINDVNNLKNAQNWNKILTHTEIDILSNETNIPFDFVYNKISGVTFHNTREMLQVIGTDLIRTYNNDWHVNKIKEYIINSSNEKFVIDDVRFPNEREMIEELGGTCWFIVRPKIDNVSNHISETALKWQDFDNVIVNDSTIEYLKFNWNVFMANGYEESLNKRTELMHKLIGNKVAIDELFNSNDKFTMLDALLISKYEFTYNARFNSKDFDGRISTISNGHITIVYPNDTMEYVINPLMIEDLKCLL